MKTLDIMKKEKSQDFLKDLQNTQKMCEALMMTPHYKKMGSEGIFAILEKARCMGIDPMEALNGGFYFVQGKVEMTAAMMNHLIRVQGHSITKQKNSDETICILHGKRADNQDTWMESFSIDDAKLAGIYRSQWLKYPKDMLFARALSRLARQLFPDVIKGCYVEGEIQIQTLPSVNDVSHDVTEESQIVTLSNVTKDECNHLDKMIGDDAAYRKCVMAFINRQFGSSSLDSMSRNIYDKILPVATAKFEERKNKSMEFVYGEKNQMDMEV